ncbi:MAG: FxsA family protein [Stackebrandtia sp.]
MTSSPQGRPPGPSLGARLSFILYFAAELAAFVAVVYYLGWVEAILLWLATTMLGGILLRTFGMRAMRDYRDAVEEGKPPGPAVVSGVIGVVGAFLLLLPGFVTDAVGLLCVFPLTRFLLKPLVIRFLESRLDSPSMDRMFGPRIVRPDWVRRDAAGADAEDVVEGEIVEGDDPRRDGHIEGPTP